MFTIGDLFEKRCHTSALRRVEVSLERLRLLVLCFQKAHPPPWLLGARLDGIVHRRCTGTDAIMFGKIVQVRTRAQKMLQAVQHAFYHQFEITPEA